MADEQQQVQAESSSAATTEANEFQQLLAKEFRLGKATEQRRDDVQASVSTLAEYALKNTNLVHDEPIATIEALRAAIDERLSEQVNNILHNADFQKLEGTWRGLGYLVNNTETDEKLKIKFMHITKNELRKTFKKFPGIKWDQSPFFKKVYEHEYGMFGGEPFGCMIGDYHFDQSPTDIEILRNLAKIAASSHCPFIAGANPSVVNMESWQELNDPRDLTKTFQTADYAEWRALRESDDSRFIGLAMPRYLSRLPYGAKTDPVDEFDFEEECDGSDHNKYAWSNSAYAMGVNINRAFKLYGWCSRIRGVESGGVVENLPCHTFPSLDGGVDMKCPTEIAIPHRREAELAKNGFMPLCHKRNTNLACFIGAQSLQKPTEYEDSDATANARLSARLPYLFAACRFAHYLKHMVYEWIGQYTSREQLQDDLQKWLNQYKLNNPEGASQREMALKPLADCEVIVSEIEDDPGYYSAKFALKPHYQLEGLTAALSLVAKLPSQKQS